MLYLRESSFVSLMSLLFLFSFNKDHVSFFGFCLKVVPVCVGVCGGCVCAGSITAFCQRLQNWRPYWTWTTLVIIWHQTLFWKTKHNGRVEMFLNSPLRIQKLSEMRCQHSTSFLRVMHLLFKYVDSCFQLKSRKKIL